MHHSQKQNAKNLLKREHHSLQKHQHVSQDADVALKQKVYIFEKVNRVR